VNTEQEILRQAIRALKIDVPVMGYTLRQGEIELRLYGGGIRVWRYAPAQKPPETARHRRQTPPPPQKAS